MIPTYSGWLSAECFSSDHASQFKPCIFRNVQQVGHQTIDITRLLGQHTKVDVSCLLQPTSKSVAPDFNIHTKGTSIDSASRVQELKGNPTEREYVQLSLAAFTESFVCANNRLHQQRTSPADHCSSINNHHWLDDTGLNLYLSQAPIYFGQCSGEKHSAHVIEGIMEQVPIPAVLKHIDSNCELYQVNLWMNRDEIISSLHLDGNHNILVVHQGSKSVTLVAPDCYAHHPKCTYLNPAYATSTHHSTIAYDDIDVVFPRKAVFHIDLQAGDALFIPEGWWHAVRSEPCTVAINYWFRSPLHALQHGHAEHMLGYMLRSSLHQMVTKYLQSIELRQPLVKDRSLREFSALVDQYLACACGRRKRRRTEAEDIKESIEEEGQITLDDLGMDIISCEFTLMQRLWPQYASGVSQDCAVIL